MLFGKSFVIALLLPTILCGCDRQDKQQKASENLTSDSETETASNSDSKNADANDVTWVSKQSDIPATCSAKRLGEGPNGQLDVESRGLPEDCFNYRLPDGENLLEVAFSKSANSQLGQLTESGRASWTVALAPFPLPPNLDGEWLESSGTVIDSSTASNDAAVIVFRPDDTSPAYYNALVVQVRTNVNKSKSGTETYTFGVSCWLPKVSSGTKHSTWYGENMEASERTLCEFEDIKVSSVEKRKNELKIVSISGIPGGPYQLKLRPVPKR